jgi:hypothetical protein
LVHRHAAFLQVQVLFPQIALQNSSKNNAFCGSGML